MAWGKAPNDATGDFLSLCKKIETSKTVSSSLTLLHSRYAHIFPPLISEFCSSLAKNTSLIELNCVGFEFGVSGCHLLSKALVSNSTLKRIAFGNHTSFNDEQLLAFLTCCSLNRPFSLIEFDFESRNLTQKAGEALGLALQSTKHRVHTIKLTNNTLGNQGLLDFCQLIFADPVHVLLLASNDISQVPLHLPHRFHHLTRLDLSNNPLGYEGMAILSQVHCEELILNNCQGGNSGCIALALGKRRKVLSLANNDLTFDGIRILCESLLLSHEELIHLSLSRNERLGEENGLEHLANTLSLRSLLFPTANPLALDLSHVGATRIPKKMFFSCNVQELRLAGNTLKTQELVDIFIGEDLVRVKSLCLTGTGLENSSTLFQSLHGQTGISTLEFGGIPLSSVDREALQKLNEVNPDLDVACDKGDQDQ